ncbi:ATP-dependent DNA helicase RecG [Schlesneria paludicola]|uniref:ATP-dependent DNA helicase RecG n=1 Tax=Schlesneria paludicola TaxID=360056 RepID=UPI00029A7388|nr:ATP-dependent DNA helicase RecG [Schlesneria paludicola]
MSVNPSSDPLQTPAQFVRGVGPARAELLARMQLITVTDMLFNLPRDILDLSHVTPVFELKEGELQTVFGVVVDRDAKETSTGKTMVAVLLQADGGFIRGVYFNQPYMFKRFELGQRLLVSGKPKFSSRRWEFSHPRIQWLGEDDPGDGGGILPVYSLTEGLAQHEMRRLMKGVVEEYAHLIPDPLPESFRERARVIGLANALQQAHLPNTVDEHRSGMRRILFDDLLEFQLGLAMRRRFWKKDRPAIPLPTTAKVDARIRRLFRFHFTAGQNHAVNEISQDLAKEQAMHRLLQADVGAGKTAVAVYSMLVAIAAGTQAVIMAPTEVLASQHWQTIDQLLAESRVTRRYLTGSLTAAQRRTTLDEIATGTAQLVVGTQAVIQDAVRFHKLGLAVIDEQHKFGVMQRAKFNSGDVSPHVLVMTATPIPRSLCLTQFGDLDLTSISDLPPGRQKVVTSRVFGRGSVQKAWEFIKKKLGEGRQAYVVCPRVEENATLPMGVDASGSAEAVYRELSQGEFKEFRVGLVHGQQDRDARSRTMDAFREGELGLLIATTVIEVGVDVPNATVMVINQAERFGLSQLHQLRGRIGRGKFQGYCFLFSDTDTPEATKRLAAMESTSDGFRIAEVDFELRGPGDVLGVRQSGSLPLRVADLIRDRELLLEARTAAFNLVETGEFDEPEYAPLKICVLERFSQIMNLPQSG